MGVFIQTRCRLPVCRCLNMGHLRMIIIMLSLTICVDIVRVDEQKNAEMNTSTSKSDKMMKYEGKDEKWLCKKCLKTKFAEKHEEDCSKCKSLKKDEDVKSKVSDCSNCKRKKFRERNDFCKECVDIQKKDKTKSKIRATKKPYRKPSASVYPSFPVSKIQSKAPAYSKTTKKKNNVQLGPFATLLRDLI